MVSGTSCVCTRVWRRHLYVPEAAAAAQRQPAESSASGLSFGGSSVRISMCAMQPGVQEGPGFADGYPGDLVSTAEHKPCLEDALPSYGCNASTMLELGSCSGSQIPVQLCQFVNDMLSLSTSW